MNVYQATTVGSRLICVLTLWLAILPATCAVAVTLEGRWIASLETPGGALRFQFDLSQRDSQWTAHVVNGPERIEVPHTTVDRGEVLIEFTHYDSRIQATYDAGHDALEGSWTKRRGTGKLATLKFSAKRPEAVRIHPNADAFLGKWRVDFDSDDQPAVGIFRRDDRGRLWGTFLTTVGDYRYLSGNIVGGKLELSCFDGGHAFLMRAALAADGSLQGDFWSGDWWHESWTAERDERATLPNAFELSRWNDSMAVADLRFPDLDGNVRNIVGDEEQGQALILEIFGSWCPNCHDAGQYLTQISHKYHDRGLRVIGLAFELTGDTQRDAEQVRQYQHRNGLEFPAYLVGLSDKKKASAAFPALDRIRAFPTLVFVDRNLKVRAVYTGFSGPATGERHQRLREQFESIIEEILE
jgi:thiol-disulfide isomerase/thioredoxin